MTITLLAAPPAAHVVRHLANRGDRNLYDAACAHCGPLATFDPNAWTGRAATAGLRHAAARDAAHRTADNHTCPHGPATGGTR